MSTIGLTEVTIHIPRTGQHKVGLHLWDRDGNFKWPSISERRSPTEKATSCVNSDRTEMPAIGLTEFTIRIARN